MHCWGNCRGPTLTLYQWLFGRALISAANHGEICLPIQPARTTRATCQWVDNEFVREGYPSHRGTTDSSSFLKHHSAHVTVVWWYATPFVQMHYSQLYPKINQRYTLSNKNSPKCRRLLFHTTTVPSWDEMVDLVALGHFKCFCVQHTIYLSWLRSLLVRYTTLLVVEEWAGYNFISYRVFQVHCHDATHPVERVVNDVWGGNTTYYPHSKRGYAALAGHDVEAHSEISPEISLRK